MADSVTIDSRISMADAALIAATVEAIYKGYGRTGRRVTGRRPRPAPERERRDSVRHAVEIPFYLYPCLSGAAKERTEIGEPVIALTRDMSQRGLGFSSDVPIPQELAIAEFDVAGTGTVRLLVNIRWSLRKTRHSYLFGGQILSVLDPASTPGDQNQAPKA